jgi:hypothetical protein
VADFVAENDLERALVAASTDRLKQHDFYERLLGAQLHVIDLGSEDRPSGARTLEAGVRLQVPHVTVEGRTHVTVFSSLTRLQHFLTQPARYVSMRGRDFFEMVNGSHVCLNPGSGYGKLLLPDEISRLLDGSIFKEGMREIVVQETTQVRIGRPADPQLHIIRALTTLFDRRRDVSRAHLAWWLDPKSGVPAHAVVAVETSASWKELMTAILAAIQPVTRSDEIIDFLPLDESPVAKEICKQTSPFFQRRRFWPFG